MKKLVSYLLCIVVLILQITPIVHAEQPLTAAGNESSGEEKVLLSTLSEAEAIEFLKENDVLIPDIYEEAFWGPFIKSIISQVEQYPDIIFGINYSVSANFAENIRKVVNHYYGYSVTKSATESNNILSITRATLADSIVYGSWDDNFENYNCYAYAIDTTTVKANPGLFKYLMDGGTLIDYEFDIADYECEDLAELVCADLDVLGKERIYYSWNCPNTDSMCTNETIICVRKGPYDFHFMRYDQDLSAWMHKPSTTHILQYKYEPTESRDWSNERSIRGVVYDANLWYTSEIFYISFNGHNWYSYTNHNTGTHSRLCNICGDSESEKCDLEYVSSGSSGHYQKCSLCGYRSTTVAHKMTYSYTSSNKHKATCSQCGYTTTESCNSSGYQYYGQVDGVHKHRTACDKCNHVTGTSLVSCLFKGTSTVCSQCKHDKGISGGTIMKKPIQTEQQ